MQTNEVDNAFCMGRAVKSSSAVVWILRKGLRSLQCYKEEDTRMVFLGRGAATHVPVYTHVSKLAKSLHAHVAVCTHVYRDVDACMYIHLSLPLSLYIYVYTQKNIPCACYYMTAACLIPFFCALLPRLPGGGRRERLPRHRLRDASGSHGAPGPPVPRLAVWMSPVFYRPHNRYMVLSF